MPRAVEGPHACWRKHRPRKEFPSRCIGRAYSVRGAWVLLREPGAPLFSRSWREGGDFDYEPSTSPARARVERTPPSAALRQSQKRSTEIRDPAQHRGRTALQRHVQHQDGAVFSYNRTSPPRKGLALFAHKRKKEFDCEGAAAIPWLFSSTEETWAKRPPHPAGS